MNLYFALTQKLQFHHNAPAALLRYFINNKQSEAAGCLP